MDTVKMKKNFLLYMQLIPVKSNTSTHHLFQTLKNTEPFAY